MWGGIRCSFHRGEVMKNVFEIFHELATFELKFLNNQRASCQTLHTIRISSLSSIKWYIPRDLKSLITPETSLTRMNQDFYFCYLVVLKGVLGVMLYTIRLARVSATKPFYPFCIKIKISKNCVFSTGHYSAPMGSLCMLNSSLNSPWRALLNEISHKA